MHDLVQILYSCICFCIFFMQRLSERLSSHPSLFTWTLFHSKHTEHVRKQKQKAQQVNLSIFHDPLVIFLLFAPACTTHCMFWDFIVTFHISGITSCSIRSMSAKMLKTQKQNLHSFDHALVIFFPYAPACVSRTWSEVFHQFHPSHVSSICFTAQDHFSFRLNYSIQVELQGWATASWDPLACLRGWTHLLWRCLYSNLAPLLNSLLTRLYHLLSLTLYSSCIV